VEGEVAGSRCVWLTNNNNNKNGNLDCKFNGNSDLE
jgi:hypothetical protein